MTTRILVVDDEPQILRALRINLHRPPVRRRHRRRRRERPARSAARDRPDLVVLDLGLPDMDGVDVIRRPARLDPGADHRAVRPGRQPRQGRRPRRRRRRLRHQTVQHRRTPRPDPSRHPARRRDAEPQPPVTHRPLHASTSPTTPSHAADDAGDAGPPHPHRMAAAGGPGPQPGQADRPTPAAARGLGPDLLNETHYLRQYMAQLRRKLEADPARPRHLLTEPGMGYRFQP